MEREKAKGHGAPLDSTLTELILNPKSQKIRRPPNAFMIFARENRKWVSQQNPDITNKDVSTLLGQMWKEISPVQKATYFNKANQISLLHKARFPEYVYSPIEARMKKMEKMKIKLEMKTGETVQDTGGSNGANQLQEGRQKNEEDWRIMAANYARRLSSPGYVPNNPQYFSQQGLETSNDESSTMVQDPRSCPPEVESFKGSDGTTSNETEMDCLRSPKHGRCGCCNPSRMGFRNRCFSPCEKDGDETMRYFTDLPPYPFAPPSSFCNSARPWTRPLNPLYCGSPCTSPGPPSYRPPFHPHWNLPPINIPCCQTRDCPVYEDFQPCSLPTPCRAYTPDYYPQHYGYFDRSAARMVINSTPRFRQVEEEWNLPPRSTCEDSARDRLELQSHLKDMDRREVKMASLGWPDSGNEDGMRFRSREIVGPEVTNREQFAYCCKSNRGQQDVSSSNINDTNADEMCQVNSSGSQYQNNHQLAGIGNYRRNAEEVSSSSEYFPAVTPAIDFRNNTRNSRSEEISDSYDIGSRTQIRNVSSSSTVTSEESSKIMHRAIGIPNQNTIAGETANYIEASNQNFHEVHKFHGFKSDQPLRGSVNTFNNGLRPVYGGSIEKLNDLPESCFSENDASVTGFKRPVMNLSRMPNEFHSTNLCEDNLGNSFKTVEDLNEVAIATKIIEDTSCQTSPADQKLVETGRANLNINAPDLRLYGSVRKMTDFQNSCPMNFNRSNTENGYRDGNKVIFHGSIAKKEDLHYSNFPSPVNLNRSNIENDYGNQSINDFKSRITGHLNDNHFIPISENNYECGSGLPEHLSTQSDVYHNCVATKSEASSIGLTTVTTPSYVHLKSPEELHPAGKQCNRSFSLQQNLPGFSTFMVPYQIGPEDNEAVNETTTNGTVDISLTEPRIKVEKSEISHL